MIEETANTIDIKVSPKKFKTYRSQKLLEKGITFVYGIFTSRGERKTELSHVKFHKRDGWSRGKVVKWVRRHGMFMHNPLNQATEIYSNIIEIKAQKGSRSLWPGQKFYHRFGRGAKVYGLKDGSLLIKGSKPLWKTVSGYKKGVDYS